MSVHGRGHSGRRVGAPPSGRLAGLLAGDPVEVAPQLLNKVLVHGATSGRIVEVEAYRGEADPASHAFRGPTARNRTMFGRPGLLYVYFSYGMHHCCNVVCWPERRAGAVLVRALLPLGGIDEMRRRRHPAAREDELCSGPGRLCQALGLDRAADGADLLDASSPVRLLDDGVAPPLVLQLGISPRVGINPALASSGELWRFYVRGDRNLSRREPATSRG